MEFLLKKEVPVPERLKRVRDFIRDLVPDCQFTDIYMAKFIEIISNAVRAGIFHQFISH
jgi:hypothetical protein